MSHTVKAMNITHLLYCAATFASNAGGLLSLAMVIPANNWRYAEVIDRPESLDEHAQTVVLPKLTKIPGAQFVKSADLHAEVAEFITRMGLSPSDTLEIRCFAKQDHRLVAIMRQGAIQAGLASGSISFGTADPAEEQLNDFYRHCGGAERACDHALVNAVGGALCDRNRQVPTNFHEGSIHHFELLMGSKNATSYRAWARATERAWLESHGVAA